MVHLRLFMLAHDGSENRSLEGVERWDGKAEESGAGRKKCCESDDWRRGDEDFR